MNEFKPFDDKLAGLLASLSPAGRRRLAVDIAKKLRQSQQQRIKSQKAPDGTAYAPRKRQPLKAKSGRIKREMFARLRTNKYLKATGSDSASLVQFTGSVMRIAKVHHYGLRERSSSKGSWNKYNKRELLGLGNKDVKIIESELLVFLKRNG